ncbi:MAG: histidine phosphatase family protein [Reyranella sp.]|uniref:histidine phosphatase family protein n=1 Tax=Reyranella sp. TaxID=1929291 RepID=UPI001AD2180A|nr:histidine phosphatase family protein [Reyranella sp.]MBN9087385.1 histidine phosphatase family protein [Reyranella sp.]
MSVPFAVLRHAPTAWNGEGRLQGATDIPLSADGEDMAKTWHLPAPADHWKRMCSPLIRARRTAELVQPSVPVLVDSRLREMSFGIWEGKSVAQLRAERGERFAEAERLGLDFHPPGGESPRMTMDRLKGWAAEIAATGEPAVAVTHKAAIRALLALATGWDMTGRQPLKLDWRRLHFFSACADGSVTLDRPNVSLSNGPLA